MANIMSVGTFVPPNVVDQQSVEIFVKELFDSEFRVIDRLLKVFQNGQIEKRHFAVPLEWFKKEHDFKEKNDLYIHYAVELAEKAVSNCMSKLNGPELDDIDAIIFVSSSGISTPTIDARLMNRLPFSPRTKRIPLWGLGCAGGASGLSRGYEYVKAYPDSKVLVISVELCSMTFQQSDHSKSNLIGTSLFADGAACALLIGDQVDTTGWWDVPLIPRILDTQSELKKDSLDVMGWDVKNEGLFVIFSKDIPGLVHHWMRDGVQAFLAEHDLTMSDISHFVAHPGGKKVLDAYREALQIEECQLETSFGTLKQYGNMSSATILFVLEKFMNKEITEGDFGMAAALGPGFSSELLLLQWKKVTG